MFSIYEWGECRSNSSSMSMTQPEHRDTVDEVVNDADEIEDQND
jgi:hypothetical protein